jgi:hypothetical protein
MFKNRSRPLKRGRDIVRFIGLRRALCGLPAFRFGGHGVVLARLPEGTEPSDYAPALLRILYPDYDPGRNVTDTHSSTANQR